MLRSFINSFQSEWLKRKGSLAAWIIIVGGSFTPLIIIVARIINRDNLIPLYSSTDFWLTHWQSSWESMAIFLLPIGLILATSLITQIEYKNNTWKQLYTVPLSLTTIYISKLAVLFAMLFQFFILFNIGIYLSAVIPCLLLGDVPYPTASIPFHFFATENFYYMIDCLPVIGLQYLVSLKHKNFIVPVGAGFLMWIVSLASLKWRYGYFIPYTYLMFDFLKNSPQSKAIVPLIDIHLYALGFFGIFVVAGFVFYFFKKEKG